METNNNAGEGSPDAACSAWRSVQDPPEKEGWYIVWVIPGEETNGYIATFEQAYYTPRIDDWEPADSCGPLSDGCYVTHWAKILPPNEKSPSDATTCSACDGCTMLPGCEEDDDVMNTPCWKCNENAKLKEVLA